MDSHQTSFLLLIFLLLLVVSTTATISAALPPPITPLSTFPQQENDQQLNNIIDALIGSGDFNSLKNVVSSSAITTLPLSATFFIPSNDFRLPLDPFIFPYHIVPQRLSFSDLLLLKPFSRLPTLLPNKSILVTNTSASNFTLDSSVIFYPDLYLTSNIAVHGIQHILDYSVYGDNNLFRQQPLSPPTPPPQVPPSRPRPAPPSSGFLVQQGEVAGGGKTSDAACLWRELQWFSLWFFGVLAFKIYGSPPVYR